jgi:hypothetical protein
VSDNDATRKRHRVADPLRLYADNMYANNLIDGPQLNAMRRIADQIDREHERRMEQQSYELRKAFCRYMGGVLDDYRHGMKRKRLRK